MATTLRDIDNAIGTNGAIVKGGGSKGGGGGH